MGRCGGGSRSDAESGVGKGKNHAKSGGEDLQKLQLQGFSTLGFLPSGNVINCPCCVVLDSKLHDLSNMQSSINVQTNKQTNAILSLLRIFNLSLLVW